MCKGKWSDDEINYLKNNSNLYTLKELSKYLERTENAVRKNIKKYNLEYIKCNGNTIRGVYNKLDLTKYDWVNIQEYYDDNKTWRDVSKEFNINMRVLTEAKKEGMFISRTRSDANKLSNKLNPRTLSDETKKKISEARIKYLRENPDKVPYKLNHYSKGESYPEKYFRKILEKTDLKFEQEVSVSSYRIDFAFYDNAIDLEIDGDQHYLDDVIVESNKRRDEYLSKLGWEIIRIKWSDYQKIEKENRISYINDLLNYIKNKNTDIPKIILYNKEKYYCKCGNNKSKKAKLCIKCHNKEKSIINKPTYKQLLKEIDELGYMGTGRKYNVSDNSIRNWKRFYEKYGE